MYSWSLCYLSDKGVVIMELLNPDLVKNLLEYGGMAIIFGFITIVPIEIIVYGVMKAISWFKL